MNFIIQYPLSLSFSKQQNAKRKHNAKIVKYPQATPPQHTALSLKPERRYNFFKRRFNFLKGRLVVLVLSG